MVRWYQQRKPVDLIQACRDEADAARPQAPEAPDFMDALIANANRYITSAHSSPGEITYEILPPLPEGWKKLDFDPAYPPYVTYEAA